MAIGANDLLENVISLGGPDERFGILIMHSDVLLDSRDQFGHAAEDAARQTVGRDAAKVALDHVEPRSGRRREMDVKARMLLQPRLDLGMLVRGVVVADQVQLLVLGRLAVDLAQEVEPFDMAMALRATGNHGAVQRTHRGKQRGRAVALVVVGHRLRPALLERQPGLRAIQCLHLDLLVAAQHQGMLRRRHIQTDDVFEFLDELRIARDLEGLDQVRLEAVGAPHLEHRRIGDAQLGGQLARAPVSGALRLGLRRRRP